MELRPLGSACRPLAVLLVRLSSQPVQPQMPYIPQLRRCVYGEVREILKRNGAGPSSEFSTDPHRCRRSVSPRWTS